MIKSWQWCPALRNVSCYYYPHLARSLSHREQLQKTTTAHQHMPGPGALVSASCTRLRCSVQKGVHGDLHGHRGVSPSPAIDRLCGPSTSSSSSCLSVPTWERGTVLLSPGWVFISPGLQIAHSLGAEHKDGQLGTTSEQDRDPAPEELTF